MLAGAVNYLLKNADTRRAMMSAGVGAVDALRGSLERTMRAMEPFVQPLIVKAGIETAQLRKSAR